MSWWSLQYPSIFPSCQVVYLQLGLCNLPSAGCKVGAHTEVLHRKVMAGRICSSFWFFKAHHNGGQGGWNTDKEAMKNHRKKIKKYGLHLKYLCMYVLCSFEVNEHSTEIVLHVSFRCGIFVNIVRWTQSQMASFWIVIWCSFSTVPNKKSFMKHKKKTLNLLILRNC